MDHAPRPVFLFLLSLVLLPLGATSPSIPPQQPPAPDAAFYQSLYRGRPITHPEALSGVWEASDGHGGVLGMDLQLSTYRRGRALAPLHGETWESLTVGIFRTTSPSPLFGEEHFFSDSRQGGSVRYDHRRLVLHLDTTDLDLTLQPGGIWTGRFHSGMVDAIVTLVQIGLRSGKPPGLLGTWRSGTADRYICLHIAEPVPGSITAWQDQHQNNDVMRFAPQIPRPSLSLESYGGRFSVRPAADRGLLLATPPSLAACCAHVSRASVRHGILSLNPGPDPMPAWSLDSTRWDRMPGNTCAPPPPPPAKSAPRFDGATVPPPHTHPVSLVRPAISPPPPPRTPPCLPSPVQ